MNSEQESRADPISFLKLKIKVSVEIEGQTLSQSPEGSSYLFNLFKDRRTEKDNYIKSQSPEGSSYLFNLKKWGERGHL